MDKFLVICNQPRLIQEERENLNSPISRNKIKFLIKKQKQTKCSKALPKVKLVPKKGHGYCSVVCCPSDPPQLSESLQNSANWWDAVKLQCLKPILVNRNGPILLHNNTWLHVAQSVLQKLNKLGYKVLPHLSYSPDLLSTDYHFFRLLDIFFQGKCFHD